MKKLVSITREEYFEIYKKYRSQLTVFSTATWPDYVSTAWGFHGAVQPSIKQIIYPIEGTVEYFKTKSVKVNHNV